MARSFNGSTDKITINGAVMPNSNPTSVAAFAKLTNNSASQSIVSSQSAGGLEMQVDYSGTGNLRLIRAGQAAVGGSNATVTAGTWTALGLSSIGNTAKFYIGGIKDTYNASAATGISAQTGIYIGTNSGTNEPVSGSLAYVAIWNALLTDSEFFALARGVLPDLIRPQALYGSWRLDGYNHPALDSSIYRHHGVLSGTAFVPGPPQFSAAPVFLPQNTKSVAVALSAFKFRRTNSALGTRTGSRQVHL